MQLRDLKQSVCLLSNEEQIALHRIIRKSRMTPLPSKSKAKSTTTKKTTKAQAEIRQDPEKIKELLRLLGEDV